MCPQTKQRLKHRSLSSHFSHWAIIEKQIYHLYSICFLNPHKSYLEARGVHAQAGVEGIKTVWNDLNTVKGKWLLHKDLHLATFDVSDNCLISYIHDCSIMSGKCLYLLSMLFAGSNLLSSTFSLWMYFYRGLCTSELVMRGWFRKPCKKPCKHLLIYGTNI